MFAFRPSRSSSSRRSFSSIVVPVFALISALLISAAVLLVASLCVACLASPPEGDIPERAARIVTIWDPLACGDPQRVVIELEAESGARFSRSAPCVVGTVSIDVDHWGFFFARAYAWVAGVPRREEDDIAQTLAIDAPIVYWQLPVPVL